MTEKKLPPSVRLKLDLLFEGVRYSPALEEAGRHAFPNFYPFRFDADHPHPRGEARITIPYLMSLADDTLIRVQGNPGSPWHVQGGEEKGYALVRDGGDSQGIRFEPLPRWMGAKTSDGLPMAQAGVSLHGDMAVINVAPGCEYFLHRGPGGDPLRCVFCAYGAPNERVAHFAQATGDPRIPEVTLRRLQETLVAALEEGGIRHLYLVGGSMADPALEGERYLQLAAAVQEVNQGRIPVTCGSGALAEAQLESLYRSQLVDQVCFNLEIWSEPLFRQVCPGKERFVGYRPWLESLEQAVHRWGRGRVYTAMVAGVELEPRYGLTPEAALEVALEGAEALCGKGIIPVYSLYWPTGGRSHPDYLERLRAYFEALNLGCREIREREDLWIDEAFMCHRCAYMQIECDLDRGLSTS